MKKLIMVCVVLGLFLMTVLSGCGGGSSNDPPKSNNPGDAVIFSTPVVSFTMHYVPGGMTFPTKTDNSGNGTVATAYLMAETEVTWTLWKTVYDWAIDSTRTNPYTFEHPGSKGSTDLHPVTDVDWRDAMVWCNALTEYYNSQNNTNLDCTFLYNGYTIRNSKSTNPEFSNVSINLAAKGFRLPQSDEWELAARYRGNDATNALEYPSGSGKFWTKGDSASGATAKCSDQVATGVVAWFEFNCTSTQQVGTRAANRLGLRDMSGNVAEWSSDGNGTSNMVRSGSFGSIIPVGWGELWPTTTSSYNLGFRFAKTY